MHCKIIGATSKWFIGLLFVVGMSANAGAASFYKGEYCWEIAGGATLRLAMTDMADRHFIVSGRIESAGEAFPVVGSAEVIDGTAYVTLRGTQRDGVNTCAYTFHVQLDSEMSGIYDVFESCGPGGEAKVSTYLTRNLSITRITCP